MPGKVLAKKGNVATIDYFGEKRHALSDLSDFSVGDYVYVQAGFVVKRIPKEEVEPTLAVWKDMMARLKKTDSERSKSIDRPRVSDRKLAALLSSAKDGKIPSREQLLSLLSLAETPSLDALFYTANAIRMRELSNSCCVHGIIEFSNYCSQRCAYCGISAKNPSLSRYRLSIGQIVDAARIACKDYGFQALVLQSGEDPFYSDERLVEIVRAVRKECQVVIFMSVGERSIDCFRKLYAAGARGVLLRFESSNPKIYSDMGKGDLASRISLLRELRSMGYLIITGALIGLPGQTDEDILNDILLTKELGAEMFSFGPFLPHPQTSLAKAKPPPISKVLAVLAAARFAQPDAKILVTTALETLDEDGREHALLSGANSLMINATPLEYRKLYSIYPNKAWVETPLAVEIRETISLLRSLGRAPTDLGVSKGFANGK